MKKILSGLLASAMIASMPLGAFATGNDSVTSENNSSSINVSGQFVSGAEAEVLSVGVAWSSMNFTYTEGGKIWNPVTHTYETTEGGWSSEEGAGVITATNHSNVGIEVDFDFTVADGMNITGAFTEESFSLNRAEENSALDSQKGTTTFSITGGSISADSDNLGTITVNIQVSESDSGEEEEFTVVTDEASLIAAIANGGNIQLGADITVDETLYIENTVVLDLNGKTLMADAALGDPLISISSGSQLTIDDSGENGQIYPEFPGSCLISNNGTLNINGGNITSDSDVIYNYGILNITDGNIQSNATCICALDGEIKISGGTLEGKRYIISFDYENTATLNISGGALLSEEMVLRLSYNAKSITVTGGTMGFNPTDYINEDTHTATQNSDATWTVTVKTNTEEFDGEWV